MYSLKNSTNIEWVKSLSRVRLFVTPWTVAHQAPQSMGFSRQQYWSGLPFPSPGDLPDPGIEPGSPPLQADALSSEPPRKPLILATFKKTGEITFNIIFYLTQYIQNIVISMHKWQKNGIVYIILLSLWNPVCILQLQHGSNQFQKCETTFHPGADVNGENLKFLLKELFIFFVLNAMEITTWLLAGPRPSPCTGSITGSSFSQGSIIGYSFSKLTLPWWLRR